MSQAPTPQTVERQIEDPDRFADANFPDFTPHRPERPAKSEGGIAYDLQAPYEHKGDQPQAIGELVAGETGGEKDQVLLGVTGRSEEHTSELQSLMRNSYAVFCMQKKQKQKISHIAKYIKR